MTKKITTGAAAVLALFVLVFLISSLPILIVAKKNGIELQWHSALTACLDYLKGLGSGDSFIYTYGKNEHHFLSEAWTYAGVSLSYIVTAVVLGIWLSVIASVMILRWRLRLLQEGILLLSVLPDFVIIVMLQLFAVYLHRQFGIHIAIASFGHTKAVLLPVLSITIVPFLYLLRQLMVSMQQIVSEDFIMVAKAKGIGRTRIYFDHVVPNLLPALRAELPKLIGIIFSSLFIIEYLYNLSGITRLLFQKGAQFSLIANGLFVLFGMYVCVYGVGRFSIWGLKKLTTK
ncbi:ABC transporter permease subunit [Gorillibacterium massiliense]|uniref:ABC transporter permease subunit n=1 Tax=Gorillibacterium massiliense TaxID=1280390 RepID=UPI0004B00BDD|nr:ABC transporter permease subunit [Gorillibacterium massiliense]